MNFNNPSVHVQSWYVAGRSRAIRRRAAKTLELFGRRITLFRGDSGALHALDARCPHLGSDLGLGDVAGDRLRCRFHGWTFDGDGSCPAHDARAVAYPVEDRHGFIWIFNGPVALFSLPASQWDAGAIALPSQIINAHPHLIACNGLDLDHFEPVHHIRILEKPQLEQPDPFRTAIRLRVAFEGRVMRLLGGGDVRVVFTTWGGNGATIDAMLGRIPVRVLFTHLPLPEGRSLSRTFLFGTTPLTFPIVLLTVARIVSGDRELLDRLDFRQNPGPSDWPLAAFIEQVNAMPAYP